MSGIDAIRLERLRQIKKEGWTAEHDAAHPPGTLAIAALNYIGGTVFRRKKCHDNLKGPGVFNGWWAWPWDATWWKPKNNRADLVRAGALIAAELDAMDARVGQMMWAVGHEDSEGWIAVSAMTEIEARYEFCKTEYGPDTDAHIPDSIIAKRVPDWDALDQVTGPDWIATGLSYACCVCGGQTFSEEEGGADMDCAAHIIDGEIYCAECLPVDQSAEDQAMWEAEREDDR